MAPSHCRSSRCDPPTAVSPGSSALFSDTGLNMPHCYTTKQNSEEPKGNVFVMHQKNGAYSQKAPRIWFQSQKAEQKGLESRKHFHNDNLPESVSEIRRTFAVRNKIIRMTQSVPLKGSSGFVSNIRLGTTYRIYIVLTQHDTSERCVLFCALSRQQECLSERVR